MLKKSTFLAVILYCILHTLNTLAQNQTVGLFSKDPGQKDGYVLYSPNAYPVHYLIDKCGKLVHKWKVSNLPGLDAYILPNGNLLCTGKTSNPYYNSVGSVGGLIQIYDWNGNLLWSYTISDSLYKQDHDVYPMPNGHILVSVWDSHSIQDGVDNGKDTSKKVILWSAMVQEIEPIGTDSAHVVWQWKLWDHMVQDFDSTKANYGVVANHPELLNINYTGVAGAFGASDWIHMNAVTYNEDLDQVMISSRNLSEIYIIDHSTTTAEAAAHSGGKHGKGGDFLYRWGNPQAYNRGYASDEQLFVQHDASWIPDGYPDAGKIMVFNNGTSRSSSSYSSVDVIAPPVDSKGDYQLTGGQAFGPSAPSWSYTAPHAANFYSSVQGGAQRLSNGNTLVCEATKGHFFELDTAKNIVWDYVSPVNGNGPVAQQTVPGNNPVFRCTYYPLDYPGFSKKKLTPGDPVELFPYSYSCYMPTLFVIDPLYKIRQLKGYSPATGIADSAGAGKGFIKGVVQSKNTSSSVLSFSLTDSTGAITVYSDKINYYTPAAGDSILISGSVIQAYGVTEFYADSIITLDKGTWLQTAKTVTKLDESTESELVKLNGMHIIDTAQWAPSGGLPFNVNITNGRDTFVMRINATTDLYSHRQLNEEFNVTGIASQSVSSLPYLSGYFIQPRGIADIQHIDQWYTIKQIRPQDAVTGVADSATGQHRFYTKGIVQSPDFAGIDLNFALEDSTGSVFVQSAAFSNIAYTAHTGDSVWVYGYVSQVNGLTVITADSVKTLLPPASMPALRAITTLGENTEADLVSFSRAWLVDPSQWSGSGQGFEAAVTNGKDTITLYISLYTDLYNQAAPKGRFNITGIGSQIKPSSPYLGGYVLMPRGSFDIKLIPYPLYKIRQVKGYSATTGISDSLHVFCYLKGVVQSPNLSGNSTQAFSMMDSTGAITVYAPSAVDGYAPAINDSIEVRGEIKQSYGVTQINIDSVITHGTGTGAAAVAVSKPDETTESGLISLQTFSLIDPGQWDTAGAAGIFYADATNGTDTVKMAIVKGTDLYANSAAPHGFFDVTGIGSQADSTNPFLKNYILIPRSISDFSHAAGVHTAAVAAGLSMYPNPVTGILNIRASQKMSHIEIINAMGQVVMRLNPQAGTIQADMSSLAPGMYSMRITGEGYTSTGRFVKQ